MHTFFVLNPEKCVFCFENVWNSSAWGRKSFKLVFSMGNPPPSVWHIIHVIKWTRPSSTVFISHLTIHTLPNVSKSHSLLGATNSRGSLCPKSQWLNRNFCDNRWVIKFPGGKLHSLINFLENYIWIYCNTIYTKVLCNNFSVKYLTSDMHSAWGCASQTPCEAQSGRSLSKLWLYTGKSRGWALFCETTVFWNKKSSMQEMWMR